jgi:Zn-finger nucleic acid-binding protein
MQCPACKESLKEIKAGDIDVDVCGDGCGGIWLDDLEIKKFDEPCELAAETIFEAVAGAKKAATVLQVRQCPKCEDEILWRRSYDHMGKVEVDQCPECSGIWLDTEELEQIRGQFKTEAERLNAADKFLDTRLDNIEAAFLDDASLELERIEKLRKHPMVRLSNIFRRLLQDG